MLYKLDQVPFWPFGIALSFEDAFFTIMLGIITVWFESIHFEDTAYN